MAGGKRSASSRAANSTTEYQQLRPRQESPLTDSSTAAGFSQIGGASPNAQTGHGLAPDLARRLARKERNRKAAQASRDRKRVQLEELEAENSDLRAQVVALKQTIARLRRGGGHVDDEDDQHSIPDHKHSGARHTGRTNPDHDMDEDLSDLDAEADDDDDDDDGADEGAVGDVEPGAGVAGGSGLSSGNKARLRNTKAQGASGEDEPDSVMSAVDVESKPTIKLGTSHKNNGASTSTSGSTSAAAALGFAPPKPPAAPGNKPPSSGPSDFTALAALGRAASRAARHDRHVESGISSTSEDTN